MRFLRLHEFNDGQSGDGKDRVIYVNVDKIKAITTGYDFRHKNSWEDPSEEKRVPITAIWFNAKGDGINVTEDLKTVMRMTEAGIEPDGKVQGP